MGVVVAAIHLGLNQRVAIKFLRPGGPDSEIAIERFLREAKVAAMIRSEYVARVQDVGTLDGGVPYIVMEYLEGSDLGKIIRRDGALPVAEASEIVLQACEALAEVHATGVVHRDLKPSNLFVTRRADGSPAVKLLDFGISKLTPGVGDGSAYPALTATAAAIGSPSYMSPEQIKSTKEVDQRTDVWSLGAVLYEAVTGKPAFKGESILQVCAMIAAEEPARPSALRPDLPPALETAILGCLDKDMDRRHRLVDLAGALVKCAPQRARASFDRIEATLGLSGPRPRLLTTGDIDASWGDPATVAPVPAPVATRNDASGAAPIGAASSVSGDPVEQGSGSERGRGGASWRLRAGVLVMTLLIGAAAGWSLTRGSTKGWRIQAGVGIEPFAPTPSATSAASGQSAPTLAAAASSVAAQSGAPAPSSSEPSAPPAPSPSASATLGLPASEALADATAPLGAPTPSALPGLPEPPPGSSAGSTADLDASPATAPSAPSVAPPAPAAVHHPSSPRLAAPAKPKPHTSKRRHHVYE